MAAVTMATGHARPKESYGSNPLGIHTAVMAFQAQKQKQLPDAMLTEVWTLMHLAIDPTPTELDQHILLSGTLSDDELESDSPFDGNANKDGVDDIQALKEAAHTLTIIGDQYGSELSKSGEDKLINDIVNCLRSKAPEIDKALEKDLRSAKPREDIFKAELVSIVYNEVSSRLETFLVGSEGFNKIAVVTHVTKGVSEALRDVSAPAVSLVAALSYRFVTEKFSDLILESGGLRSLVTSNVRS